MLGSIFNHTVFSFRFLSIMHIRLQTLVMWSTTLFTNTYYLNKCVVLMCTDDSIMLTSGVLYVYLWILPWQYTVVLIIMYSLFFFNYLRWTSFYIYTCYYKCRHVWHEPHALDRTGRNLQQHVYETAKVSTRKGRLFGYMVCTRAVEWLMNKSKLNDISICLVRAASILIYHLFFNICLKINFTMVTLI